MLRVQQNIVSLLHEISYVHLNYAVTEFGVIGKKIVEAVELEEVKDKKMN